MNGRSFNQLQKFIIPLSLVFVFGCLILFSSSAGARPAAQEVNVPAEINYHHYERNMVEIKFRDEYTIRLRDGRPADVDGRSLNNLQATAALSAVADGQWQRTHAATSESDLERLRAEAIRNSGELYPDLNNYFRLQLPDDMEAAAAIGIFSQLDEVEKVWAVPRPAPPPLPPNYQDSDTAGVSYQRYLDAAPEGIDARFAWEGGGGTGDGVKICDVEYDWNQNHADLPFVPLITLPPSSGLDASWSEHGTAVLGVLGGLDNGWGVTGIVHEATLYFAAASTVQGYNVANAVTACANNVDFGGIILIEQQTAGPNRPNNPADGDQTGLVPVEWYEPTYDAIKTAVATGRVVVEAGGNGNQNLDSADYGFGNGGHYPFKAANDSGAIIVGAGAPPNGSGILERSRLNGSNYGSTVDLQGYGALVVTTGYGDLYDDEGDDLNYTNFSGTSSASPIVTAAAAIVQANYELERGSFALPAEVKALLQGTGTPQQGALNIGPLPNLKAAIEEIWDFSALAPPVISPASGSYDMPLEMSIDYGAGQSGSNTNIRYTLNDSEPVADSFIFIPEFDDHVVLNYGVTVKAKAFQYNSDADRHFSSETASVTYTSTTPKVATPQITPGGGFYYQPHEVTISTTTPGATIRYRTDGKSISFFYPGTLYTGPITLAPGSYEITARAYKEDYYASDRVSSGDIFVNETTLPTPTIGPASGTYNGQVTVSMYSTVQGAEIRYTLDGSTPTEQSTLFTNPFALNSSATVKARAFLEGYTESPTAEATYTITEQATAPTIDPPDGTTATGTLQVSITNNDPEAVVRYTTNGGDPNQYSPIYTTPFNRSIGEHTVKARAFLEGAEPSNVVTADYIVYDPSTTMTQEPVIDPAGGNHTGSLTVTLSTATEGATIYYNIDDVFNPPSTLYSGPITLAPRGTAYIITAQAKKSGLFDSTVNQKSFNIFSPGPTVITPTITPDGGTFTNTVSIQLASDTTSVQFWRTTDGSDPVVIPNSSAPSPSFSLSKSATVKVLGQRLGFFNSPIVSADFTLVCDTPAITPAGGTFTETATVELSSGTAVASIYYTTNGSEPTQSDTQYTEPFTLTVGTHPVKAKCFRTNFEPSETALRMFVVDPPPVAPAITMQPASQVANSGETVNFSIEATGVPTPTYQWQYNGANLAGEVEPVLTLAAVQEANAGDYRVVVSNSAGDTTSAEATLTVTNLPTVASTTPANGESDVARNIPIVVNFNKPMDTETVTYEIAPEVTLTPLWGLNDTQLTLSHPELDANTTYTVTISAGSDDNGDPLSNAPYTWSFTTGTAVADEADLSIAKARIGSGGVTAGEAISYTLTVTNDGPTTPVTATVVDTFSSAAALADVSGEGCTWTPGSATVTCTLSDVANGSPAQVTLAVTTNEAYSGSLANTATVTPSGGVVDSAPLNNSDEVTVEITGARSYIYLPAILR